MKLQKGFWFGFCKDTLKIWHTESLSSSISWISEYSMYIYNNLPASQSEYNSLKKGVGENIIHSYSKRLRLAMTDINIQTKRKRNCIPSILKFQSQVKHKHWNAKLTGLYERAVLFLVGISS